MARLKTIWIAGLAWGAALATSFGATAQDRPPGWLKKPSRQDLLAVWPNAALKSGRGGKAVLECTVTLQGALRSCRVVSETPAGQGFGGAGLVLTSQLLMKPALKAGEPVEGMVAIPIVWPDLLEGSVSRLGGPEIHGGLATRVLSNVDWLKAPSVADVLAAYPEKARADTLGGRATLDCAIAKTGALSRCEVLQEEPSGHGFGLAARKLAAIFQAPTTSSSGASLAQAHVQVPFVFAAETLAGAAPVIGKPRWTALPRIDDLRAVYPAQATQAHILRARVVVGCTVAAGGVLSGCVVEAEDPPGYGLGPATISLTDAFRLGIWSPEGLPTIGGLVRVPVRYDFSETPTPQP